MRSDGSLLFENRWACREAAYEKKLVVQALEKALSRRGLIEKRLIPPERWF